MIKIVIPSHKRADSVLTLKLVPSAILCVAESQKDEYRRCNPNTEIVTHPDSVIGLVPKRNWMVGHFGELFMLDDDLTTFKKLYVDKGEGQIVKDKAFILEKIEFLYQMAAMLGVHLFGFANKCTPIQYDGFKWFSLSQPVTGRAYGVIGNENTKWDENFTLKEDFMISCAIKYRERKILTDNRFCFEQKATMVNGGGLAAIRSQQSERENVMRLRQYYGECVQMKGSGTNGKNRVNDKSMYNIKVVFPF